MKHILLIILLLVPVLTICQYHNLSLWYNTDNGLPQNSVKDIIKDKYGFIWMATENGIVRYDGNEFLNFNDLNAGNNFFNRFSGDIEKDSIFCSNFHDKNRILISNRTLKKYKNTHTIYSMVKDGLTYSNFYQISIFNISDYKERMFYLRTGTGKYFFSHNSIVYQDKAFKEKKINLNFKVQQLKQSFIIEQVLYLPDTATGKLYALVEGNFTEIEIQDFKIDSHTKTFYNLLTKQVFFVKNDNIYLVEKKNNSSSLSITHLFNYKNFSLNYFYSIFYDKEYEKIYLGSYSKGLNIINLKKFNTVKRNKPYKDDIYYALLPFNDRSIITELGNTYDHHEELKDFKFKKIIGERSAMVLDDSLNIFLVVHSETLLKSLYKDGYTKNIEYKFPYNYLKNIFRCDDFYFLSTFENNKYGIDVYKNTYFKNPPLKKLKLPSQLHFVYPYKNDRILFGTNDGLFVFNKKTFELNFVKNSKDIFIKSITQTSDRNIWITSYSGIYHLRDDMSMLKLPLDRQNFLLSAHCILEDRNHGLWISSNNGLFKVELSQFNNFIHHKSSEIKYYRYSKDRGFNTNEFNGTCSPCAVKLKNGEFVFPSLDGIVFFNPMTIKPYLPKANSLYIERGRINNKELITIKNQIIVQPSYNTTELFLDFPYFSNFENLYLSAKIEGEIEWENISNSRIFALPKLSPGNYTLTIRYLTKLNGEFSYVNFPIKIIPRFYQTYWFKALLALLFLISFISILQARTNFLHFQNRKLKSIVHKKSFELKEASVKLQNEEDYRKKLVETINHDISTPIKYLSILSNNLSETNDLNEKKKYMLSIHQFSEQLYKFTLSLKEYTELHRDHNTHEEIEYSLKELVFEKLQLFAPIAKSH